MPEEPRAHTEGVLTVVPARHTGRWAAVAVIIVLIALVIQTLVTNPRFQWEVVGEFLFSAPILQGLLKTLMLTAVTMVLGILIGVVMAVARLSPNPILSGAAWFYSWFFRGTPLLVQLLFWYFLSALFPMLVLGVPFGPSLFEVSTNDLISPLSAAILGLALNEGAYMGEIVRAGLMAVSPGQTEAAEAIGMTRIQVMRRVVLPQAMRIIIPPTGNETIGMLKNTSLVLVIGYAELLTSASLIYSRTFQTIPLLIVAALWYLFVTALLSIAQYYIERHYGRGFHPAVQHKGRKRDLVKTPEIVVAPAETLPEMRTH